MKYKGSGEVSVPDIGVFKSQEEKELPDAVAEKLVATNPLFEIVTPPKMIGVEEK